MAANTFGKLFSITTFGESHGKAIGVVIDGCPANLPIDLDFIQQEVNRRKPGQSAITTSRNEAEKIEVLSGIFNQKTTGSPICIMVQNTNQKTEDYDALKEVFRPSHADYTYQAKYGNRDYRGGGRASARETLARVIGGAVAKIILKNHHIFVQAYVDQVGNIQTNKPYTELDLNNAEKNIVRCPDEIVAQQMITLIEQTAASGDSVGGAITCVIKGAPAGLGEPVFDKLHAELGKAILSINACKGFEIGSGFGGITQLGSQHNDAFTTQNGNIATTTNNSGGVQGGISNGQDIYFRCAFKPVSTIKKAQQSINTDGQAITIEAAGRHDPCVVPRAVPIVEAMAAITLVDFLLIQQAYKGMA